MQQVVLYLYRYCSAGGSGLKTRNPHFIQQMSFVALPLEFHRMCAVGFVGHLNKINGPTGSGNWVVS
jgi:hypothetical protein